MKKLIICVVLPILIVCNIGRSQGTMFPPVTHDFTIVTSGPFPPNGTTLPQGAGDIADNVFSISLGRCL